MSTVIHRPGQVEIQAAPNDTLTVALAFTDGAGNPLDVSGWTLSAELATPSIVDGPGGRIDLDMDTATVGLRQWGLRRDSPDARELLAGPLLVASGAARQPTPDATVDVAITDTAIDVAVGGAVAADHELGGGSHDPDTLAALNALVSDATLGSFLRDTRANQPLPPDVLIGTVFTVSDEGDREEVAADTTGDGAADSWLPRDYARGDGTLSVGQLGRIASLNPLTLEPLGTPSDGDAVVYDAGLGQWVPDRDTYQLEQAADIRNHGAALDGSTNDLPAINDALTKYNVAYIPTLSGSPARTEVLIDGDLRIGSYQKIICTGRLLTTLVLTAGSRVMFPGRHARLYYCTVDASNAMTGIYFGEDPYNTDASRVSNKGIDLRLIGPGRGVAGSIGVHYGYTESSWANYYNYMVNPWIQDFETIAQFHQHANANRLISPHCTGYWIGVSLDCAESVVADPTFVDAPGTRVADGDDEDRDSVCFDVLPNASLNVASDVTAEPQQYSKGVRTESTVASGNYFQGSWNIGLGHDINDPYTSLVSTNGGGRYLANKFDARDRYTLGADEAVEQRTGTGDPEGSVTAPVGSILQRQDDKGQTYRKKSGTGNTGWSPNHDTSGARVYPGTAQSIADSSWTTVAFDTVDSDPDALFDDANDRIVLNKAGWWRITASIEYANNSTGSRHMALARGGSRIRQDRVEPMANWDTILQISDVLDAASGAGISVETFQDSGGSLSLRADSQTVWLSAVFLGES